jgi:hypothetical protein
MVRHLHPPHTIREHSALIPLDGLHFEWVFLKFEIKIIRVKQKLLSRDARICFPEFNIRLYDKNSESDYFSSTKIRIYFSAALGIRIFFLEKKHTPR